MNIGVLPRPALLLQEDGRILQANRLSSALFNISSKALCSLNMAALLTQYDSIPFLDFINNIVADQPENWLAHLVDKGTIRYISMDISRLPDTNLLVILDDNTEQQSERARTLQHISILECQCKHSPTAMLLVNTGMKIRSCNLSFQQMWNSTQDSIIGQNIRQRMQLIAGQIKDPEPFLAILQQVLDQHLKQINDTIELKDGRTFHIFTRPVMENNNVLGRAWYFQDISALQKMQEQLESQQIFQNAILEHIEDGIVACDANGELSMFNRASRELHALATDIPPHELWPEHYRLFQPDGITPLQPVDIPLIRALNGVQLKNEEMVIVRADGEKKDVQVSGQLMVDKNGDKIGAVISLHDITDLKSIREQLREIAYKDPLTGMPNRRLFHDLLNQALIQAKRHNEKVGVLFLDLDNFKAVNDRLGHDAGDQLLIDLAAILTGCLRDSDMICRWGGDEFVIALSAISGERDAQLVAEKICRAIRGSLQEDYAGCKVSTSIGIAIYPEHEDLPDLLIRSADMAMYEAKQQGKDRYCCSLSQTAANSLPQTGRPTGTSRSAAGCETALSRYAQARSSASCVPAQPLPRAADHRR